jgi:heterodisulfide reductase subunit A
MLEVSRSPNIEILSYSEVKNVEGTVGNYHVTVEIKPRYVNTEKCTGCGACNETCPVKKIPNEFNEGLDNRKAIYIAFQQAVPKKARIDSTNCLYFKTGACKFCLKACPTGAIEFDQEPRTVEFDVGSIIVATGLGLYQPTEYGYGTYANVINQLQLERILAPNGPFGGHVRRVSDENELKEIVFIQCVGSRDSERPFCSGVCCMIALKNAKLLKEELPNANITMCYIDIRTNEKGFEEYYQRAKDTGIRMIRGKVGEVVEDPETKNLKIRVYSSLTDEIVNINADLVVLSTAILPSKDTEQIAKVMGLETDKNGFLTESHFGLMPQETKMKGVFVAGFAQGPKNISYSVSQARAAASKVAELTSAGKIDLELITAEVNKDACISCRRCEKVCNSGAIKVIDNTGATVDDTSCEGCGVCVNCCPTHAIDIRYYREGQLFAEISSLLET